MKYIVCIAFILISSAASAKPAAQSAVKESKFGSTVINLLFGSQFRFEDGADQERSLKSYSHLALTGFVLYDYWWAFETASFKESTGNSSLRIEREASEYNIGAGYSLWRWNSMLGESNWHFVFNLVGAGFLGQNKNTISTTLLGSTQKDSSSPEWSMGAGVVASARLQYLTVEVDTRMMSSKSYEPQNVSVSSVRLGVAIPLN